MSAASSIILCISGTLTGQNEVNSVRQSLNSGPLSFSVDNRIDANFLDSWSQYSSAVKELLWSLFFSNPSVNWQQSMCVCFLWQPISESCNCQLCCDAMLFCVRCKLFARRCGQRAILYVLIFSQNVQIHTSRCVSSLDHG